MANVNANPVEPGDDVAGKAVNKRYEGLIAVRTKAIKGKGAWYWAHLEPIMVLNPETNLPKAVKLKCTLCNATFSASNPSRTATEHLKRGTCPNFGSVSRPISTTLPPLASPSSSQNHHKRRIGTCSSSQQVGFCNEIAGSNQQQHLVLSGGKEDLGALAMLEDSVKKLKSLKNSSSSSPGPALSKDQVDSAFNLLADWFYESCGTVTISSIEHPKFKAFLNQVGLPPVSKKDFVGEKLDAKFDEARMESEARIRDAAFFQVASDGWGRRDICKYGEEHSTVIKFIVNLPNGTNVFHKAVYKGGLVPSEYAEEVLHETVKGLCGNVIQRCVGIVADKYKGKALRNLEIQNHWMVNLSCQLHGFISLLKDFSRQLPLFKTVTDNCFKIANLFNSKSQIRNHFRKFRSHGVEFAGLIRVPSVDCNLSKNFGPVIVMLEDILSYARILQLVVLDDSFKVSCIDDPVAREVAEMIQDVAFWNGVEAVHSLVKLIKEMADDIEAERPLVGQCLLLWEELRAKVKDWCVKFSMDDGPIEQIIDTRFKRNYHPAWSAAFVLDPLYLVRDASGKYLPPVKRLTHDQEKDIDKLITRLVPREEAPIALMELMKWRSEGLDPLYAQAVQVKQRDPVTGRMKIANPQSSRLVWETCLKEFKSLGKVAVRLLFLQATSCGFKCNWSFMKWVSLQGNSRVGMDRAQKMILIAAHAKLGKGDFCSDEETDAEMLSTANGEDDMFNEVFVDAPSV